MQCNAAVTLLSPVDHSGRMYLEPTATAGAAPCMPHPTLPYPPLRSNGGGGGYTYPTNHNLAPYLLTCSSYPRAPDPVAAVCTGMLVGRSRLPTNVGPAGCRHWSQTLEASSTVQGKTCVLFLRQVVTSNLGTTPALRSHEEPHGEPQLRDHLDCSRAPEHSDGMGGGGLGGSSVYTDPSPHTPSCLATLRHSSCL